MCSFSFSYGGVCVSSSISCACVFSTTDGAEEVLQAEDARASTAKARCVAPLLLPSSLSPLTPHISFSRRFSTQARWISTITFCTTRFIGTRRSRTSPATETCSMRAKRAKSACAKRFAFFCCLVLCCVGLFLPCACCVFFVLTWNGASVWCVCVLVELFVPLSSSHCFFFFSLLRRGRDLAS